MPRQGQGRAGQGTPRHAGQTVLVTGAAGGVGGYAVELAKHGGLTVIAAAGDQDEELVRRLGADHFVRRSAELATAVREIVPAGVDTLVDAAIIGVGAQEAVRNGGRTVHLQAGPCICRPDHGHRTCARSPSSNSSCMPTGAT